MRRNRLAGETSPYLQQHADNPVDWYPWCEEALAHARREDKPILLSIGYSACHWCHVMAHESFEDPATAEVMNRLFVNIKVDREERPDLDKIYQTAQQLLTQRAGGWPLTMFLTPDDQQPFFGGTYFPREASHGLPAFKDLLERVAEYYHGERAAIRAQSENLAAAFERLQPAGAAADGAVTDGAVTYGAVTDVAAGPGAAALDDSPLQLARAALERSFDRRFGGFGAAPKFPHPQSIERCLRDATPAALSMASLTLTGMAEGGLYDQLGGGFARYSVDASWTIPHFEKMLYDNAQLLGTYAAAAAVTGDKQFARIAGETADWVLRDMRAPQGGFYSSLDADSEGHEGRFYVWTAAEVRERLNEAEYAVFARRFGLDQAPNFEGRWHLRVRAPLQGAEEHRLIESARAKLLAVRTLRVWPGRDEKVLTSWNALMIRGLAIAARTLHRPDLADAATRAVDFIHRTLWQQGRLLATYKDGRAHLHAYLDDYAFLADALLELLQARWRDRDLEFAHVLAEAMLDRFADREGGGFYFTASDHERLIHRSKTFGDESIPAGNAVAAGVLCRLGYLLGEPRYLAAAERTLRAGFAGMREYPEGHMSLIAALEDTLKPLQILILRGPEAPRWQHALAARYAPSRMVLAIPADTPDLPAAIAAKRLQGPAVAYLCTGTSCSAPFTRLEDLGRVLDGNV
jgi:uncharacterized protein YyaL (SSP411 family)